MSTDYKTDRKGKGRYWGERDKPAIYNSKRKISGGKCEGVDETRHENFELPTGEGIPLSVGSRTVKEAALGMHHRRRGCGYWMGHPK